MYGTLQPHDQKAVNLIFKCTLWFFFLQN